MTKVGIVSAMKLEIEYVLSKMEIIEEFELKNNLFYLGTYVGKEFVLVATGVGKVNAAVYTQILLDNFKCEYVINLGIAGGMSDKVKPLDLVLGTSFAHHDVRTRQMEQLYPYMAKFNAHPTLVNFLNDPNEPILTGLIVSGESFIENDEKKLEIIKTFQPIAVDMETSSIAHCCYINEQPFIALRGISDLANHDTTEVYENNEQIAADKAGAYYLKQLDRIFG